MWGPIIDALKLDYIFRRFTSIDFVGLKSTGISKRGTTYERAARDNLSPTVIWIGRRELELRIDQPVLH